MAWNEQSASCLGVVFFRGQFQPRAQEFSFLTQQGVQIQPGKPDDGSVWALHLEHPSWGRARLWALRNPPPVPSALTKFDPRLTATEKRDASLGKSSVGVQIDGDQNNVLKDRKRLLRFLNAVMGNDGLIALDLKALKFWSRDALADELAHDADLDIDSLFTIHAINGESANAPRWMHTHGLAEIGFFDFDVVRPSADLLSSRCQDFSRAVAFQIVEGKVQPSTPVAKITSAGPLRLVDIKEFNRRAARADRAMRDDDETHNHDRTVLCEPEKPGAFSRIFGLPARPSRMLSQPQGDFIVYFTTAASRLMAVRAVQTYTTFKRLVDEFAEMQAKPIVKISYIMDGGGPTDLEHLWFEVNRLHDESIDATLLNTPHAVSSLKAGQRSSHSLSQLTDWMLLCPTGMINPRNTQPARLARNIGKTFFKN